MFSCLAQRVDGDQSQKRARRTDGRWDAKDINQALKRAVVKFHFITAAMTRIHVSGCFVLAVVVAAWVDAQAPSLPQLDPTEWWGPSDMQRDIDESIRPYQIEFSDE
ncbi:jg17260, partial [Pararge aegeria aegeria]